MEAQRPERHVAWLDIEAGTAQMRTAILLTIDTKAMQMHIAPGEDDLQRGMEGGQRHVAADKKTTPDQWADPLHDHTELIGIGEAA